jgi:hypothetical protein
MKAPSPHSLTGVAATIPGWRMTARQVLSARRHVTICPENIPEILPWLAPGPPNKAWRGYVSPVDPAAPDLSRLFFELALTISQFGGFIGYSADGTVDRVLKPSLRHCPPADYRIPQILEGLGILQFSERLTGKIGRSHVFRLDAPEVRAISAAAVEGAGLIKDAYERHYSKNTTCAENLERLLQANARLNVAYLLREQFEQLWDYADARDARAFCDAWRGQLRDQDLKPYEKFARMVEKHWDGIAVHCQPTHTIPLCFVEGLNNKVRVIQRKAYGLRDEEYLKLKILTSGLPEL